LLFQNEQLFSLVFFRIKNNKDIQNTRVKQSVYTEIYRQILREMFEKNIWMFF